MFLVPSYRVQLQSRSNMHSKSKIYATDILFGKKNTEEYIFNSKDFERIEYECEEINQIISTLLKVYTAVKGI